MSRNILCLLHMHQYQIHAEEAIVDPRGNVVGKVIVSVCQHCGRVKATYIHTVEN